MFWRSACAHKDISTGFEDQPVEFFIFFSTSQFTMDFHISCSTTGDILCKLAAVKPINLRMEIEASSGTLVNEQRIMFNSWELAADDDDIEYEIIEEIVPKLHGQPVPLVLARRMPEQVLWIELVMRDGKKLSASPDHIREDPVVVKVAIRNSAASFEYASHTLQKDPHFVRDVVRLNGEVLAPFSHGFSSLWRRQHDPPDFAGLVVGVNTFVTDGFRNDQDIQKAWTEWFELERDGLPSPTDSENHEAQERDWFKWVEQFCDSCDVGKPGLLLSRSKTQVAKCPWCPFQFCVSGYAIHHCRAALWTPQQHGDSVAPSDEKRIRTRKVDDILYSRQSCASNFHDGKNFSGLIQALSVWSIDPMVADFLQLDVLECYRGFLLYGRAAR